MVDTGFSGFLSMPYVKAFPLGLSLVSTTNVILADGAQHAKLVAIATVRLSEQETTFKAGPCLLEASSDTALVGMEFLRKFDLSLLVHEKTVALVDSEDINLQIERSADEQPC